MLETNERGQHQLDELLDHLDAFKWTTWERKFLEGLDGKRYEYLSKKQKEVITILVDKLDG